MRGLEDAYSSCHFASCPSPIQAQYLCMGKHQSRMLSPPQFLTLSPMPDLACLEVLDPPRNPCAPQGSQYHTSAPAELWGWGDETGHAPTDISFAGVARGELSTPPQKHQPTDFKLRIKPTEEGTEPCSRPRKPPAQPHLTYVASPAVCMRIPEPVEFVLRG